MVLSLIPTAYSQLSHVVSLSKTAQLYEYQPTALQQRTPLFLIHGIGGKQSNNYRWQRFLSYVKTHPEFQERFKIYLFKYDTSQSVPHISEAIQNSLRIYISDHNYPRFRVLAFSEGGLVYRNVMQDPVIYNQTEKVITVASPFHGSPLANQKWLGQQMKENTPFSLMRLTQGISRVFAQKKHPSFEKDFRWEEMESAHVKIPHQKFALKNHPNFIAYGSYFGVTESYHQELFDSLEVEREAPKKLSHFKNMFNRHAVFRLVQQNLTAIPIKIKQKIALKLFKQQVSQEENPMLMLSLAEEQINTEKSAMLIYNDGISPISSSLWLGRYTSENDSYKHQVWSALKSLKGKQKARLFHSIDHANWMEGDNLSRKSKLPDLLNPEESPKTIFEWFIFDLTSS